MTEYPRHSGQLGNIAPLNGEFEMVQKSSGIDVLTIVAASGGGSTTAGGLLNIQTANAERGSTVGSTMIFGIETDGVWGRRKIVAVSTAACAVSLTSSQSGAFVVVGDSTGKDMTITLPTMEAGLWYEIYQGGFVKASCTQISPATAGTMVGYAESSANSYDLGGATAASVGACMRVFTDGTKWYTTTFAAFSSAATATTSMTVFNRAT